MKIQLPNHIQNQNGNGKKSNPLDHSKIPQPYIDVAKKMETEFAKLMIQQMKNSSAPSEENSSSMEFYDSLMTQEQAEKLSAREGLGVSQQILDQIYPVNKRTDQNMQAYLKSVGTQQGGKHE